MEQLNTKIITSVLLLAFAFNLVTFADVHDQDTSARSNENIIPDSDPGEAGNGDGDGDGTGTGGDDNGTGTGGDDNGTGTGGDDNGTGTGGDDGNDDEYIIPDDNTITADGADNEEHPETSDASQKHAAKPKTLPIFEILNRTQVETKKCPKIGKCWASDREIPVCGSDATVYKNPGVLMCAQPCNSALEMEFFCLIVTYEVYDVTIKEHCANCARVKEFSKRRRR